MPCIGHADSLPTRITFDILDNRVVHVVVHESGHVPLIYMSIFILRDGNEHKEMSQKVSQWKNNIKVTKLDKDEIGDGVYTMDD